MKSRFRCFAVFCSSLLLFAVVLSSFSTGFCQGTSSGLDVKREIFFEGVPRNYTLHVPPGFDPRSTSPLVIVLHPEKEDAESMERLTGFSYIADERNFLCVYPEGIKQHWNDGRKVEWAHQYNDVGFIDAMIGDIGKRWNIDRSRLYAVGMSDGGFFAQYLAIKLPGRFAAVASVAAALPEIVLSNDRVLKPVSVMLILGMDDTVVPFEGGPIAEEGRKHKTHRGIAASASRTVEYWVKGNKCSERFDSSTLPDIDTSDGSTVKFLRYTGGLGDTEVVVYGIQGGGHRWPACNPRHKVGEGKICQDFDATLSIWDFFTRHKLMQLR